MLTIDEELTRLTATLNRHAGELLVLRKQVQQLEEVLERLTRRLTPAEGAAATGPSPSESRGA